MLRSLFQYMSIMIWMGWYWWDGNDNNNDLSPCFNIIIIISPKEPHVWLLNPHSLPLIHQKSMPRHRVFSMLLAKKCLASCFLWSMKQQLMGVFYPLVIYHSYGKSPSFMGKSTINSPFSVAMLKYQRITGVSESAHLGACNMLLQGSRSSISRWPSIQKMSHGVTADVPLKILKHSTQTLEKSSTVSRWYRISKNV